MSGVRIAVMGAEGRMGRELVRTVHGTAGAIMAGATERPGSPVIGQDAGVLAGLPSLGAVVSGDVESVIGSVDAIIDFTAPAATVRFARIAAERGIVHVIGTTGLSPAEEAEIAASARRAVVIKAGNMSLGVNLLTAVVQKVAAALDADFDIEIVEMHHRHKVDAPSGTALMLAEAAAMGRGIALGEHAVRQRDGHAGARRRGDIGMQSLRGGSVVGDHTVIFAGEGERIEVTHKAQDRSIFARGAVKAAIWGHGRRPGLYSMMDVLGL
ncbi:MAG: 4-hydroxy-tetrahydrodipicolinate reductase [Hyphomicrobiaceae bacterium]|nr:4-hydroxy-tetrahydrodipicolinate reductase [Hyphomicrobiaceae bacterium]